MAFTISTSESPRGFTPSNFGSQWHPYLNEFLSDRDVKGCWQMSINGRMWSGVIFGTAGRFVATLLDQPVSGEGLTESSAIDELAKRLTELLVSPVRKPYSRDDLAEKAIKTPGELIKQIERNELSIPELTFAGEELGNQGDWVFPTLELLTAHSSPIVREGAVYGLSKLKSEQSKRLISKLAEKDQSPGVREAAREMID